MSENTTAVVETPAAPKAAKAPKAPAKKPAPAAKPAAPKGKPAPAKAPKAEKAASAPKSALSPQRLAILRLIAKSKAGHLSRKEIGDTLGIKSGFCSLLGHADPDKVEAVSLVGRGLLKVVQFEGEPTAYQLTTAGRKAVEKG